MKTLRAAERGQCKTVPINSFAFFGEHSWKGVRDESRTSHRSYSAYFDPRADRLCADALDRLDRRRAGVAVPGGDADPGTDADLHPKDHFDGGRRDTFDAVDQPTVADVH